MRTNYSETEYASLDIQYVTLSVVKWCRQRYIDFFKTCFVFYPYMCRL